MTLNQWKEKCTRESILEWFTDKDHYRVGLDNGGTINKIMHDLGFRNPKSDMGFEALAKIHFRNRINAARAYLKRDGFLLVTQCWHGGKAANLHYIIDNLSEERVSLHYKLKKRLEGSMFKFRNDKLDLISFIPKVKTAKLQQDFKDAYASKPDFSPKKNLKLLVNKKKRTQKLVNA